MVSDLVRNINVHFDFRLSICSHPFPLAWLPAFQRDIQHPSVYFLQLLYAMCLLKELITVMFFLLFQRIVL